MTQQHPIHTIIFDLGGVLIEWDPMRVYRQIFDTEEEATRFLQNICTYEWNMEHDAGRPVKEGMDMLVAQHPEWSKEIYAYYGRWEEMLAGAIDETVAVLKSLIENPKYRVIALTNWSAETFPIAKERFDFLHWFEGIVVSGEEKTRKPYPEIYEIMIKRYDIQPEHALFIDDSLPNIEQAKRFGIRGIHCQNPQQLQADLKNLGIDF